jgi:hypothetical protein
MAGSFLRMPPATQRLASDGAASIGPRLLLTGLGHSLIARQH